MPPLFLFFLNMYVAHERTRLLSSHVCLCTAGGGGKTLKHYYYVDLQR